MADTRELQITDDDWSEISQFGNCGYFTNNSQQFILCTEAENKPDASSKVGHPVVPASFLDFDARGGQKVWGRSTLGNAVLAVTPTQ